jgi:hypothetical protein
MACPRCGKKATIRPAGSRSGASGPTVSNSNNGKQNNPKSVITGLKYVPK